MLRITFFILLILASSSLFCQKNLVIDGGFENSEIDSTSYVGRNDGISKMAFRGQVYDNKELSFRFDGWMVPIGSPDLFSLQNCEGRFCAGIWTIQPDGYTENLVTHLKTPLIKDSTYLIKIAVRPFDRDSKGQHQLDPKTIGFILSTTNPAEGSYPLLLKNYEPIRAKLPIILPDTAWTYAELEFKASGNERFLTIGAFTDPARNKRRAAMRNVIPIGYILIDQVSLSQKFTEPVNQNISLSIYYDEGIAELSSQQTISVQEFIRNANDIGIDYQIHITSYASSKGDRNANLLLSRKRAEEIRKVLLYHKVPPASIINKGEGEIEDCEDSCRRSDIVIHFDK